MSQCVSLKRASSLYFVSRWRRRAVFVRWNRELLLALLRRIYWSDEIQLSFQITIYSLAEKPRHSCIREYARVGFCLVISGPNPAAERGPRSSGPPAFRLQGGLPSLDTTRSRTDTYTRPSACNHPPRSPSFPRMTFRLSCCTDPRFSTSPR